MKVASQNLYTAIGIRPTIYDYDNGSEYHFSDTKVVTLVSETVEDLIKFMSQAEIEDFSEMADSKNIEDLNFVSQNWERFAWVVCLNGFPTSTGNSDVVRSLAFNTKNLDDLRDRIRITANFGKEIQKEVDSIVLEKLALFRERIGILKTIEDLRSSISSNEITLDYYRKMSEDMKNELGEDSELFAAHQKAYGVLAGSYVGRNISAQQEIGALEARLEELKNA